MTSRGGPAFGVPMDAGQVRYHLSEDSFRSQLQRRLPPLCLTGLLVVAGLCWLSWPSPAQAQPACAHGVCEEGASLSPVCDPCVDDVCNDPVLGDAYCCAVEWDDNCVDLVLPVCGDVSCAEICSHNPCEIGEPLDSTCNSCTELVCSLDSVCCDELGTWDQGCIDLVEQECGYQCDDLGSDICSNALPAFGGTPITPGKRFGTLLGASLDGCETGNNSCQAHDVWYSYTHTGPVIADLAISTCTTQRSFGIDTVLSVHEGCPGKKNNEIRSNDDHFLGLVPGACVGSPSPINLDSAIPLGGFYEIDPGQTVVIRVAHHNESVRNNFELRFMPEPAAWQALVAGVGALGVLWRRRARG
jgi:hypothetical protein